MFRFGDPGGRSYGSVGTSNANLMNWWTTINNASAGTILSVQSGGGRTVGSSLRFTYGNNNFLSYITKTLDSQATWGVAFGVKINALPGTSMAVAAFLDSTSIQCDVRIDPVGTLSCTRNGTVLGTTAGFVTVNNYIHLELKVTIHPSAGTVGLWVNGVQRLNLTGINTRNTANSSANVVAVGAVTPPNSGPTVFDFDDIIVYDGQTTDALGNADITGPIGDCGLVWLPPNGAGATTQLTSNGGANYGQLIDSSGPDGDTTYVESATVGNLDTYAMTDLPGNVTAVKSIAEVLYARKTDVGSRGITPMIRTGGTNYVHPTEIALSDSYSYQFRNWGTNPNTLAAWTVSDVNGVEAGQKITS